MNRDLDGELALLEVSRLQRKALEYDLEAIESITIDDFDNYESKDNATE